jgi:lipopolysaccharide/colanic/teichoic acid biosynthesis glycosyltransferase
MIGKRDIKMNTQHQQSSHISYLKTDASHHEKTQMVSKYLPARNIAVLLILVLLVAFLYVLAFIRVQKQPWSSALYKHEQLQNKSVPQFQTKLPTISHIPNAKATT